MLNVLGMGCRELNCESIGGKSLRYRTSSLSISAHLQHSGRSLWISVGVVGKATKPGEAGRRRRLVWAPRAEILVESFGDLYKGHGALSEGHHDEASNTRHPPKKLVKEF